MLIYEKSHRARSGHLFPRKRRRRKVNVPDRGNYGPDYDSTRCKHRPSIVFFSHKNLWKKKGFTSHCSRPPRPQHPRLSDMCRSNGFGREEPRPILTCIFGVRPQQRRILPKRGGRLPERPFDVATWISFVTNNETIRWRVDTEWNGCRGTKIQNARLNNRGVRCFLPAVSRVYRRHTGGYARVYDGESNIFSADRFLSPRSGIYHVQIMYA